MMHPRYEKPRRFQTVPLWLARLAFNLAAIALIGWLVSALI